MRILKRILWILLLAAGVLAVVAFFFVQSLKPVYEGEASLSGLNAQVDVQFDNYGIPHIFAESEEDAFRALGYVHAQDRLWQMELLRRVAPGRLSEVFGADLVETDQFFLSLGIEESSRRTVAGLDKSARSVVLAQAYLGGVNAFIDDGPTPVEYYLTGLDKSHFSLEDIHNAIGYMAFSFAMAHKTDPLLTDIRENIGPEYLLDLEIDVSPTTEWIKNHPSHTRDSVLPELVASVHRALKPLPVPQFIGSNSWVISPTKTANNAVILANDPHIGFAQPSVWYEAHLVSPTYEKYGYHLAGIPFPLLGHDRKLAYGLTMFENDDIDFFREKLHPQDSTKYQSNGSWKAFDLQEKRIRVKDGEDVVFTVRRSEHGPVLNGKLSTMGTSDPVTMSWIYTRPENQLLEALYGISHAEGKESFKAALPLIHAPGLNVMYGDAEGNVAWWATASLYKYPDSIHTKFLIDGASGIGIERPLAFEENPQAENPPWNYVYSANNQPDSIAGMLYPGYYLPENRGRRIVSLLEAKDDWDRAAVSEMITDVVSPVNQEVVGLLVKELDLSRFSDADTAVLDELNAWNGEYSLESVAATVYHRWIYHLLKQTFEDELGETRFDHFLKTHFHKRVIAEIVKKPWSVWWDNVRTEDQIEDQRTIVNSALSEALASLHRQFGPDTAQWAWRNVHILEHQHPIGQVEQLRSFFNVGPFPVHGTREVINNLAFLYNGDSLYQVNSGPSTRRIIDFSDVENSISILPTGQSGNPFSPHYEDQAPLYNAGKFRKMLLNAEEIRNSSESLLIFTP